MDLYFSDLGDLAVSPSGDLAITERNARDDLQQAYMRVLTEEGDFLLYPDLGASLSQLIGKPQSPATGKLGEKLIKDALNREGRFIGKPFSVKAVPVGPQTIRFDVRIISGNQQELKFSVEQDLQE